MGTLRGGLLFRLATIPPAVLLACFLCFLALRAVPGDALNGERQQGVAAQARLAAQFGLDRPWQTQWGDWCGKALRGDFGESWRHRGVPVAELLAVGWPVSLQLGACSLALGVLVGLPTAVAVKRRRSPRLRRAAELSCDAVLCLPGFLLGPLLVLVFRVWWPFPVALAGRAFGGVGWLAVTVLAVPVAAATVRWGLQGLDRACATSWWAALMARGIDERRLWWHYGLGSALPALVAALGPVAADLLAGAIAVESLTGLPGLGMRLAEAAAARDTPLLLGALACTLTTVMLVQWAADVGSACLLRTADGREPS